MMLASTRGMVNKVGHYNVRGLWDGSPQRGRGLGDAYCDSGYYYDPTVDNCVLIGTPSSSCDPGYHYDMYVDNCVPDNSCPPGQFQNMDGSCVTLTTNPSSVPTQTIGSDGGNSQIWQQIIQSVGRIATTIVQATGTQYRTNTGYYSYGTGPYSGLTPTLAQQYLASRSTFGGMNTTTMLLIGGALVVMLMLSKR